ncbi:MAG TPA: TetR/AcrR family transcriptional regulator [Mycobacterium sp.]|nr:TetR/AcrR family transcriptional regulator [Mycobacterium sp.]
MARRRGWAGDPPRSDDDAAQRIVSAAVDLITDTGAAVSLGGVANSLGITRQTVYRYFPTADALMQAAAIASVDGFLDRLAAQVRGIHDPADAMVEGVVYTLDAVSRTPSLGILLSGSYPHNHTADMASVQAHTFGMRMIGRFDVDWEHYGFDDAGLRDLVEFTLRIMMSFFVAPNDPARSPTELRRFLRRWLGEAILAHTFPAQSSSRI